MTDKALVLNALQQLPEDASIQTIYDKLEFVLAVREGLKDADEGRFVSLEEVEKKIEQWPTKSD